MKISVIIPTYNEKEVLYDCLVSLDTQNYQDYELIIIDDGSKDETIQIAKNYVPKNYNLRLIEQNHQGPAMARNRGAKAATGKILVFVDADMLFDKKFLTNLVRPIISEKSRGTFSKDEFVSNWDNVWARCWNINQNLPKKRRLPKNYPDKQKVFRAILKSEFVRIGGFEKGGYTDDWSLYKKLGYQATAAKGAFFYHKNPSSLKEVFNHAKWVAKRQYKLGMLGIALTLLKSTLPISLLIGKLKAIRYKEPFFIVFKLVYDLAVILGIIEMLVLKKFAK